MLRPTTLMACSRIACKGFDARSRSAIRARSAYSTAMHKSLELERTGLVGKVYPKSQSYKPYQDLSAEDASDPGEEEAFLEKPNTTKKNTNKAFTSRHLLRLSRCLFNASVLSCIISTITASLVLILLLVSTQGHPMKVIKATAMTTFTSAPKTETVVPLHGHGPHGAVHSNTGVLSCGASPAEARSLGCVFDIMSFAWTPAPCYDHATSKAYLARNGPWVFYLDHNATQPLPFEELENYEIVWTEHSYHIVHCLYAWERGHMAMDVGQGTLLPSEMGSIDHTRHCVDLLDDVGEAAAPAKKVNAIAYLVYDGCKVLE